MAYIKNKSNYVLKKQHQLTNDGVIFERDITTIGGISSFGNHEVPIYNSGNFIITVNESTPPIVERNDSDWLKNNDSDEWTLSNLGQYIENEVNINNQLKNVYDMRDFAYYGSCSELIRVSINNILSSFPGELYVPYSPNNDKEGITYSYIENGKLTTLYKKFSINVNNNVYETFICKYIIENPFDINIHGTYTDENSLGYFANRGYENYDFITKDNKTYSIKNCEFVVGNTPEKNSNIGYVTLTLSNESKKVIGIFKDDNCSIFYMTSEDMLGCHIRPKKSFFNEFLNGLDKFETILYSSNSNSDKQISFEVISENSFGYATDLVRFILPISQSGYNIDIDSPSFDSYVNDLIKVGEFYDDKFCDNLYRCMTHESIKNLDNTTEEDSIESANKMSNLLRIIARFFDEIKLKIDDIKNINALSYNNEQDSDTIKNLVSNDGWDITKIHPFDENNNIIQPYLYSNLNNFYKEKEYTVNDVNDIMLKNLRLNSRQILRHKGSIIGAKMLLGILGLEEGVDYNITENISVVKGINDENIINKIKKYNSFKTINYDSNVVDVNDEYIGLPVKSIINDGQETLYPFFKGSEQIDGNPYYQMNGGWLNKWVSNSESYNHKETLNNIKSVYDIKSLLSLNRRDVFDGCIYKVENLTNNSVIVDNMFYNIYSVEKNEKEPLYVTITLTVENNWVRFGDNVYYDRINTSNRNYFNDEKNFNIYDLSSLDNGSKVYLTLKCDGQGIHCLLNDGSELEHNVSVIYNGILYTYNGFTNNKTNYFKLENTNYQYELGEGGWSQLDSTSDEYKFIKNINNYYNGNNPHCGNLKYDDGSEYMRYFSTIFKYAVDNNLFDERCLDDNDFYEISNIGFNDLFNDSEHYNRYVNNKISFNGKVYGKINETNSVKTFYTQNPSKIDSIYGSDCVTIEDSVIKQLNINEDIEHIDDITTIFSNGYNSNSVINTKCINITLNVDETNKNDVEFIDKCIVPYLEQILPSNIIVSLNSFSEINNAPTTFKCTFETNNYDETIKLFNDSFNVDYIADFIVDNVYYGNLNDNNFTFESKGKHNVKFNLTLSCNSLEDMFKDCINLTEIVIKDVSLNGITSFSNMFNNCNNLVNSIFENVKCDDVNTTNNMFKNCVRLDYCEFNNTTLPKIQDTSYMFSNCQSLTSIDMSHMICNEWETMVGMFQYCEILQNAFLPSSNDSIDLNGTLISMSHSFVNCHELNQINLFNINTNNLQDSAYCFSGCTKLNRVGFVYGIDNLSRYQYTFDGVSEDGTFILYDKFNQNYQYDNILQQIPNWEVVKYIGK